MVQTIEESAVDRAMTVIGESGLRPVNLRRGKNRKIVKRAARILGFLRMGVCPDAFPRPRCRRYKPRAKALNYPDTDRAAS